MLSLRLSAIYLMCEICYDDTFVCINAAGASRKGGVTKDRFNTMDTIHTILLVI